MNVLELPLAFASFFLCLEIYEFGMRQEAHLPQTLKLRLTLLSHPQAALEQICTEGADGIWQLEIRGKPGWINACHAHLGGSPALRIWRLTYTPYIGFGGLKRSLAPVHFTLRR